MNSKKIPKIITRHFSYQSIGVQMRTWQIFNYGNLKNLNLSHTFQTPSIKSPNHVLVKVKAASINPIDIDISNGYGASVFNIIRKFNGLHEFPVTLGRDFSGTIVDVGQNVRSFEIGMDVIGALWPFEQGSHSDYVVCCQSQLALKPVKLTHIDAAAIPYAGLTAYSALVDFCGLKARESNNGKRVLILGSSGGVGTLAVQIAKSLGAHVSVTCREHSEEMLLKLGADVIMHESVKDNNFDIIFDCIGNNIEKYGQMLKPGPYSRFVTIKHPLLQMTDKYSPVFGFGLANLNFLRNFACFAFNSRGVYLWAFFRASGANLDILSKMVDRNSLVPVVRKTFDFEKTPEAYEAFKLGSINGKIIINVSDT